MFPLGRAEKTVAALPSVRTRAVQALTAVPSKRISCLTAMQNWAAQMGWWKASMNCPSASWHS